MPLSANRREAGSPRKRAPNMIWRKDMSEFLMSFLVCQAKTGLKVGKSFNKQAFSAAADAINERFAVEVSQGNIENHLRTIKAKYKTIKRLLGTPAFTFDPEKKQMNMECDALRKHLKVHPNDEIFINKPIEFFDEMTLICTDDCESGSFVKGIMDGFGLNTHTIAPKNLSTLVDDGNDCDNPLAGNDNCGMDNLLENSNRGRTPSVDDVIGDVKHLIGDDNSRGKSRSTEDDILDEQFTPHDMLPGPSAKFCRDSGSRLRKRTPNFCWRSDMSQFLVFCLVKQAKEGLKIGKFFKRKAYVAAALAVSKRFNVEMTETNVENHLKTIRKKYAAIKKLIRTPGVTFDQHLKQINMPPEDIEKHLKDHPSDEAFLNKPIELLDEMAILSDYYEPPVRDVEAATNEVQVDVNVVASRDNEGTSMNDDNIAISDEESTQLQSRQGHSPSVPNSRERNRSKKRIREAEVQVLRDISSNMCELVAALKSSLNKDIANELYAEIMKCEGFEEEALGMAFDHLMESELKARCFMAKSKSLRQSWLSRFLQFSPH